MPAIDRAELQSAPNRFVLLRGSDSLRTALLRLRERQGQEWWTLLVYLPPLRFVAARFSAVKDLIQSEGPEVLDRRLDSFSGLFSPVSIVMEDHGEEKARELAEQADEGLVVVLQSTPQNPSARLTQAGSAIDMSAQVIGILNYGGTRAATDFDEASLFDLLSEQDLDAPDVALAGPPSEAAAPQLEEAAPPEPEPATSEPMAPPAPAPQPARRADAPDADQFQGQERQRGGLLDGLFGGQGPSQESATRSGSAGKSDSAPSRDTSAATDRLSRDRGGAPDQPAPAPPPAPPRMAAPRPAPAAPAQAEKEAAAREDAPPMPSSKKEAPPPGTSIGSLRTEGDFVAGDKSVAGDEVHGDKVLGDKVTHHHYEIKTDTPLETREESRRFEAAIPQQVLTGDEFMLSTAVMLPGAPSPFAVTEVRTQGSERTVALPVNPVTGKTEALDLEVEISSADCDIIGASKKVLTVYPDGRTEVLNFHLQARKPGVQKVIIEINYKNGRRIYEYVMETEAFDPKRKPRAAMNLSLTIASFSLALSFG